MNSTSSNLNDTPSRVFISHSGVDKAVADHICDALEESGVRCWIAPRDITPGKSWASSIIEAITACDIMVLVYSENSNRSQQVLREVERALQRQLHFITYRIDDSPPCDDLEYFLSTVQWLDAYSTDSQVHLQYLVKSVQNILDPETNPVPIEPRIDAKPSVAAQQSDKSKRPSLPLMILASALLAAVISFVMIRNQAPEPSAPLEPVFQTESSRNMAVLPFQNLSQSADLDWLRSGLTEMIITDLSQSEAFHVLSSQALYQAIANSDGEIDPVASIDQLQQLGQKADVSSVLTGSFARLGETLEVSIKIQHSMSGEILLAERSSGSVESVFSIIDGLSGQVRDYFGRSSDESLDKDLREVTTDSLEAYRFYVQGLQFDLQLKRQEAIPLLERAVEIDPGFAMAHARLGWIYQNLGLAGQAAASIDAAIEHGEKLPSRERYMIQGLHFAQRWESYAMAVDAFQNALAIDPSLNSVRHQLATLYAKLEMFTEAIELWEALREERYQYAGIENGLAIMYSTENNFEKGEVLLQTLVRRNTDNALAHVALGWHYTSWGRFEEAQASFSAARDLQPSVSPFLLQAEWRAVNLKGDRQASLEVSDQLLSQANPYANWLGHKNRGNSLVQSGEGQAAIEALETAGSAYSAPNAFTAMTWLRAAELHLNSGNSEAAITDANLAVEQGQGEWPEWEARFLLALAENQRGNRDRALELAEEIQQQATTQPGDILQRLHHRLAGRMAMDGGDFETATSELAAAQASLSARGFNFHFQREPDHAAVWFDLGRAYLANEQHAEAAQWFQAILDSGIERTIYPSEYVQAHYYLGLIADEAGSKADAQKWFKAFLSFWGEGDMGRELVADAQNRSG